MANITCHMCGTTFNPTGQKACAACPLQTGCQLVCCPNCGFEVVDPESSSLARAAGRFFTWLRSKRHPDVQTGNRRLTELTPGTHARILGFDDRLSPERRTVLQAYGVLCGGEMWVRQNHPVTVIQVEHTELALENDLAAYIQVIEL